jgi:hypothetical protein
VKSSKHFGEAMVAGCLRTAENPEKRASENAYSPTRRIPDLRTSENPLKAKCAEFVFHALG